MSQFFALGGQSIGASASASVYPMNIQNWFPLGLTGLISLQSKRLSRVFSNTTVQKHQFFGSQLSLWANSYLTIGKTIALTRLTFVSNVSALKIYIYLFIIFNWRVIALENVVFCQTATWIRHRYTYILFFLKLPPFSLPSHTLGWYWAPFWVSWALQQIPLGYLFTYGNASFHVTLHTSHPLLPSPHVHNLFFMSVSPLWPCK